MTKVARLLVALVGVSAFACGGEPAEPEAEESAGAGCGPNGVLHIGLGVPPHCDCNPGYVDVDSYCISGAALQEAAASNPDTSTPPPANNVARLLPMSCFVGPSACDPRNGGGCTEGDTCDFSNDGRLECFPPPNEAALGESCDNEAGPFCAAGGWCWRSPEGSAACHRVCCSSAECTEPGLECVRILNDPAFGSLGVCRVPTEPADPAPSCLPAGARCSPSGDPCCGFCHIDHCH